METRTCKCGCGQTFKVATISQQRFASQACEAEVTPGGMEAVMKRTGKKHGAFRAIPPDRHGVVGSTELLGILNITYMQLFNWCKQGRIKPLPSESRNKTFDLDQVRAQLAGSTRPARVTTSEPQVQAGSSAVPPAKVGRPKSVPEIAGDRPAAQIQLVGEPKLIKLAQTDEAFDVDVLLAIAERSAVRKYRKRIRALAESATDPVIQLALLKRYVALEDARIQILPA